MTYDEVSKFTFTSSSGTQTEATLGEYLNTKGQYGDIDISNYIMGQFDNKELMRNCLDSIQNALSRKKDVEDQYKGSITINDTYFYNSGIASIAMESMFNGPFLYSAIPSEITNLFSKPFVASSLSFNNSIITTL